MVENIKTGENYEITKSLAGKMRVRRDSAFPTAEHYYKTTWYQQDITL